MSYSPIAAQASPRRFGASLAVGVVGLLLTVGFYHALGRYVPNDSLLVRYCSAHWVEYVETWLFFWAFAALLAKARGLFGQRAALRVPLLPAWSGQAAPVSEAKALRAGLERVPRRFRQSLLVRRVRGTLDFVGNRGSTDGLDEQLRSQADADANTVEGSYAFLRFVTWAIPILGFLGTVLGITDAIANVTPEQLAKSITGVTDGLAIAFDTTAIALVYSMVLMFGSFLIDRGEQGVLQAIDGLVEQQLAHRFERVSAESSEFVAVVRQNTDVLVQATDKLVERQTQLWSHSLEEMRTRFEHSAKEQHDQLTTALRGLFDQTVQAHQQRLAALEKQTQERIGQLLHHFHGVGQALKDTTAALDLHGDRAAKQAGILGQLLDSEQQLVRLQKTLSQNLQVIAQTGTFEQAVHSLTAAIHLLTARSQPAVLAFEARKGNAA